jgi:hypothetical protein
LLRLLCTDYACAPQILDRRCADRLNASGIRYGMIGA